MTHLLSANQAKTAFGEVLIRSQREPVRITKNGKETSVMVSAEYFSEMERLKEEYLELCIREARSDLENNRLVDGESFIKNL
ncbi:type II toxin-antitoxin system prevent-host-death family antitoxin [Vibrio sp.]|nr:type II toxin-antitoxin system prevent-host-death family antitoxin [Vibrio sp.]